MTDGLRLGGAYSETLSRIKGQGGEKSRLGMTALMWISHSERPLNSDELCHAIGVEIGSADLDAGNVPSIETLIGCCQGLVAVDKEASTVRLIHFTLQEYLRAHPELFGTPHATMAETCLSYLSFRQVNSLPTSLHLDIARAPSLPHPPRYPGTSFVEYSSLRSGSSLGGGSSVHSSAPLLGHSASYSSTPFLRYSSLRLGSSSPVGSSVRPSVPLLEHSPSYSSTPFLEYSSLYWGMHAKRGLSDRAIQLALEFFDCSSNRISTEILLSAEMSRFFHEPSLFSGLHCASFFGIVEIVTFLVEAEGCETNQADCTGRTPLIWAALKGHERVVTILLGRGDVDPGKPDKDGQAPLWWAASNGHEEVVKILLGRGDVNPNKPNESGGTPLWCAAKNGHEGVVKILLGRDDINPDKTTESGEAPLWCAARNGHKGVVKILLERDDVSPDKPNNYGETALWWAAMSGHEEVVKILLACDDVNPDKHDSDGRTPLWCAAESGHEGVVKMLVERDDVNPNKPDLLGQTPLSCAAKNGHEGVVNILAKKKKSVPNLYQHAESAVQNCTPPMETGGAYGGRQRPKPPPNSNIDFRFSDKRNPSKKKK